MSLKNDDAIIDGIMMWVTVAIVLAILPTILFSVQSSTPMIPANTTWNISQASAATGVSGGFSMLLIVLPVLAVVIIIGVLAILRGRAR